MKLHVTIEIKGKVDSLMLWELIKDYKMNLTDLETVVYVYGDCNYITAGRVLSCCALFGDIDAHITKGGGEYEQKKEEEE